MPIKPHFFAAALACAAVLCGTGATAAAQTSLRGSRPSVDRMYGQAVSHDLAFHKTPEAVRRSARSGHLVHLSSGRDYALGSVRYPYVLPTTRTFVQRLARQYRNQCGERLVVTSGIRPGSYRLANSVAKTVHPTGMAIDLRKPRKEKCLRWLRQTLLELEAEGAIEAVEERRPPHFHVAVYPRPYRRYLAGAPALPRESKLAARADATRTTGRKSAAASSRVTYRVRKGDSLWGIARRHGTSVERIRSANDLASSSLRPGKVLVIPRAR